MEEPSSSYLDTKFFELAQILFPPTGPSVPKVVQFTSSHYGEGVTTITLAFADFLAKTFETDSVLVMEANARKPMIGKALGLDVATGLNWVLMENLLVEQAIMKPKSHNYAVIPAVQVGPISSRGWERALFARLPEVVRRMGELYKCILIDSPPLIPHVDSALISSCTDGVVIVVEAGSTTWEILNHSVSKLTGANANILGTILNKREYYIPQWLYRFV